MGKNFTPHRIAFYVGLVVVWQIIAMIGIWPSNVFPSPYEVAEDLAYTAMDGSLFYGVAMSMWRLVVGLAIAIGGDDVIEDYLEQRFIKVENEQNIKIERNKSRDEKGKERVKKGNIK